MALTHLKTNNRNAHGPFVQLPKSVINRKEFYELSSKAVKLLIDMISNYNGFNNGDFSLAWKLMEKRGWRSRDTLSKARRELLETGFIIVSRQGGKNLTTLFAITFMAVDECKGKLDIRATVTPPHNWKKSKHE